MVFSSFLSSRVSPHFFTKMSSNRYFFSFLLVKRAKNYSKKADFKNQINFHSSRRINENEINRKSFWRKREKKLGTKVPKIIFFLLCMNTFLLEKFWRWKQKKRKFSFIFRGIVKPLGNIVFLSSITLLFSFLPPKLLFSFFPHPRQSDLSLSAKTVSMVTELDRTKKRTWWDKEGEHKLKKLEGVCVCV